MNELKPSAGHQLFTSAGSSQRGCPEGIRRNRGFGSVCIINS